MILQHGKSQTTAITNWYRDTNEIFHNWINEMHVIHLKQVGQQSIGLNDPSGLLTD